LAGKQVGEDFAGCIAVLNAGNIPDENYFCLKKEINTCPGRIIIP
jgi:hypothetical protein